MSPSFDDKILEVVAVSGCMQMALSRVVSIKSNRIAQCRNVKIQILGQEGVPVQVIYSWSYRKHLLRALGA